MSDSGLKLVLTGIVAAVVLVLVIAVWPFAQVGAGEVGVYTRLGAYEKVVGPGLHWRTPLFEHVTKMNVQTQKEETDASAASKDLQTVNAKVAVNYNINPDAVGDLYVRIGTEYKSRIIDPAVQEVVKAVTANYTAEELITKRAVVTEEVKSALSNLVKERTQGDHISITGVSIVNFDFSGSFNQAIETKVTAEQNALAAKNNLEKIKYEAQQTIETAKAQAESIRIQAQAINSQGGADYVELQKIQKWNGQGCTQYCGLETSTGLLLTK